MVSECQRVLKTGGAYVVISFGKPNDRTKHFLRENLGFEVKSFLLKSKDQSEDGKG